MNYQVNFRSSDQNVEHLDGEYSLADVIEICLSYKCSVDLYDEPGFRKGWVHPDGNYKLI